MEYTPQLNAIIQLLNDLIALISEHGNNIAAGLQIVMYILCAFFVWKVITVIYGLFGRVFFGGI